MKNKHILLCLLCVCWHLSGESPLNLDLSAEFGFTGIIKHEIQSGSSTDKGDVFDYVTQGNQDTLVPFSRFQAELEIVNRHHAILLYQPLTVETRARIKESFRYDQVDYAPADGFLDLTYAFDFWRFSYLYDILEPYGFFLSAGLSLQIRNASIVFKASESLKGTVTDNIGPVPIIKVRTGYEWDNGFKVQFDGDGFYASNKFLNGAEYPFTGYIYDLSLRGEYQFKEDLSSYLNVRFLGGGAEGTNDADEYTYNDLHTFGLALGLVYRL